MSGIRILAEDQDSVTISRRDWQTLLAELDDTEDRAAVAARRAAERRVGVETARHNYLTTAEARALLDGVNPVKVWREKRALSQRSLAQRAQVSGSYLAEIESGRKPGSVASLRKLAIALAVTIEDLLPPDKDAV